MVPTDPRTPAPCKWVCKSHITTTFYEGTSGSYARATGDRRGFRRLIAAGAGALMPGGRWVCRTRRDSNRRVHLAHPLKTFD